ncbi:DUF1054 domain-containing protein [Paenibacillus sp. GP183]|jgi:uncharacterized protein YktB (UPF0637 family)|uniref:YktB family protein n=1 Tax=Paenibacillus sp. GP183 TaxID=1882751 RepID=UPI00089C9382|nr:DUF1054 domain-containing protein [Paenibacillus sp. GP183]SEB43445.1 Uncharacterized protein YktB, UPF0637 family [Paenibacillus sp. GP183]
MSFTGFAQKDFDTFHIEGLDSRMEAIRERIQPKFKELGDSLAADLSVLSGHDMHLHIAKHLRRKIHPPVDTWLAICHTKRGYKQVPHFQVGLFDDRLFIWLALIYELPSKQAIADAYAKNLKTIRKELPESFLLSFDHMKKDTVAVKDMDKKAWIASLQRFRDVKKAELLIGLNLSANDAIVSDGDKLEQLIKETFEKLLPLYKLAQKFAG